MFGTIGIGLASYILEEEEEKEASQVFFFYLEHTEKGEKKPHKNLTIGVCMKPSNFHFL